MKTIFYRGDESLATIKIALVAEKMDVIRYNYMVLFFFLVL